MHKTPDPTELRGFGSAKRNPRVSPKYGTDLGARVRAYADQPVTVRHVAPRAPLSRATVASRHRAMDLARVAR